MEKTQTRNAKAVMLVKPPQTAAESAKHETINNYLQSKQQSKPAQLVQRLGPGIYSNDSNLNLLGKPKPSNSLKGFGNGFASKADRGLQNTRVFINRKPEPQFAPPHIRSSSMPNLVKAPPSVKRSLRSKCPPLPPAVNTNEQST